MPAKPLMSAGNLFTFGQGWGLDLTLGGEDATVAECGVECEYNEWIFKECNSEWSHKLAESRRILLIDTQGKLMPRRQLFFRTLQEKGYSITGLMWDRSDGLGEIEDVNGITLKRIKIKSKYADVKASLSVFSLYLKMARRIFREKFDVIHCGHLALLPLSVFMGRLCKAKVVYDVAEFYSMSFFGRLPGFVQFLEGLAIKFENYFVSKVDGVICVPSKGNTYLRRYQKYNANTKVVMNVPELRNGNYCSKELDLLKDKCAARKVIVFAGTIRKKNGAFKILEALPAICSEFPNVLLLFIGNIYRNDELELKNLVDRLDLKDAVQFVGYVPYNTLQCFLKIGDIAVSLQQPLSEWVYSLATIGNSRRYGEYMKAGLPIITSRYRDVGLIVKQEDCGLLIDTSKTEDIANAVCQLLRNPGDANRMGENGRRAVETKYNWEKEKNNLEFVYNVIWK